MQEKEKVRIFTGPGCAPCDDVKNAMQRGELKFDGLPEDTEVEFVDASSAEGYEEFFEQRGLDQVPAAVHGIAQCRILVDDETKAVTIQCSPTDSAEPDQESEEPAPDPQE